ncbi:hypothetical protein BA059_06380 [Mycolicibacterium sp. (ex Dasyatis americana)]|uniref:Uncharacterized protein n=1 Tax=Mycobacterium syngnathidarum TaxID=1908205 RepID=A0A1S1JUJ9_9MYCO|nr:MULTISPECIES: hypothetical protein [Mycobacterium]MCG7608379.1 hypothetical protein [Mycobacterium sp. CnD-18-1]OFB41696.1 hypothetical protein BA059_06380 [Mycolicibacterium sp. (ex Dasyatis americana)]OHT92294.1 hypothetical protein BKG61_24805 [Mycobacterium syngnathidarum]
MLARLRTLLAYRVALGELIVVAVVLGVPYLLVGTFWSGTHTDHLQSMGSLDAVVSFLGAIVSWPVLLFTDVCMT